MAVKVDFEKKRIVIGVRDLLAVGTIASVQRPSMGIWMRRTLGRDIHISHQRKQANERSDYKQEISVQFSTQVDDFSVKIQGRIDGVYTTNNPPAIIIEEIKSLALNQGSFAELNIQNYLQFVEQLRLYCFLLESGKVLSTWTTQSGLDAVIETNLVGRLIFINAVDGESQSFEFRQPFIDCEQMIAERIRILLEQALEQNRLSKLRKKSANQLKFPYPYQRKHQDNLIASVEQTVARKRHLLVSAPSGIGKTAGVLYPLLRFALANEKRVFFVTAKNTQAKNPVTTLKSIDSISGLASHPTVATFRAREKMCINSVYACREEFCPHIQNISSKYQKTNILERLREKKISTAESFMEAGYAAGICPFEIALTSTGQSDVVVCDYNYVFDPQVYLRDIFQDQPYDNLILVIDEAHNLVQRATDYYSPSLSRRYGSEVLSNLHLVSASLADALRDIVQEIDEIFLSIEARQDDEFSQVETEGRNRQETKFLIEKPNDFFLRLRPQINLLALRYTLEKIERGHLIADDPIEIFFSEFLRFCSVLEIEGTEFSYIFDRTEDESVKIICKDPSRQLAGRVSGFHSVIGMSATLTPINFYQQMLGFEDSRTDCVTFPSPFPPENRKIVVVPNVMTTYRHRNRSCRTIAKIIEDTVNARPGNYMALFPSYRFLNEVASELFIDGCIIKKQEPRTSELGRQEIIESLKDQSCPKIVLAVQGGALAEGVDYPGGMISGIIAVSPALPQVSFERELMRGYYDKCYGKGFEYAYLYPGMNRVIQSVGRLIRSETDKGVVVLVCRRFIHPTYASLFPSDWLESGVETCSSENLGSELSDFWSKIEPNQLTKTPLQESVADYTSQVPF